LALLGRQWSANRFSLSVGLLQNLPVRHRMKGICNEVQAE
jgi:hypothetical protein